MEEEVRHTQAMVEQIHLHIVGKLGADGLVTRVSKLEQRQNMIVKLLATCGVAVGSMLAWFVKGKLG